MLCFMAIACNGQTIADSAYERAGLYDENEIPQELAAERTLA